MTKPEPYVNYRKAHNADSRLPGKGWCFHRGAKLVSRERAVWECPSCQNFTSLTKD